MNKRMLLCIGIIVLFLSVSIAPITQGVLNETSNSPITKGTTLYVGGTGEGNYTMIQDAINDAYDGDTVFVYDEGSPYYENLKVTKSINLIGEDKNTTVVDGHQYSDVIFVSHSANGVTIKGFTIQNGGDDKWGDAGIDLRSNLNIIKSNIITLNDKHGIYFISSNHNIIISNTFSDNLYGIYGESDYTIIQENYVTNCYRGISLKSSLHWTIINNTIINNDNAGIYLFGGKGCSCHNITIIGNIISNNEIGIQSNEPGINTIIRNDIRNNQLGVGMYDSGSIKENNFIGNTRPAVFCSLSNWRGNYWDKPRLLPKPIFGTIFIFIPWVQFNWHPAKEPYDIEGVI